MRMPLSLPLRLLQCSVGQDSRWQPSLASCMEGVNLPTRAQSVLTKAGRCGVWPQRSGGSPFETSALRQWTLDQLASLQFPQLPAQDLLKCGDAPVLQTVMTTYIKCQALDILRYKDRWPSLAPRVADFQIHVGIAISDFGNDHRRSLDLPLHPLHDLAGEIEMVHALA
jgi:hypothetical protein